MNYFPRVCPVEEELKKKSVLLLGPRRTGKSHLIQKQIKSDRVYNLLRADVFQRLAARPSLLREELRPGDQLVVIDEIQKLPILMDEVHSLIEEGGPRFLLTGSSARKLKRTHTSLMAGRAKTMFFHPFCTAEAGTWNLERVLSFGMLPPAFLSHDPEDELATYVGDYLKEEIQAEALSRNISNFSKFLHFAAKSNTQLLNFDSLGRDAQISPRTIREYYYLLQDTLLGTLLESFQTGGSRKSVSHGKFYFFDLGVCHSLLGLGSISDRHPQFGPALEQFVFQELKAYLSYFRPRSILNFWRSRGHQEVDFVVDGEIAIEVKSTKLVHEQDLKGIAALEQVHPLKLKLVVSRDSAPRWLYGVEILPVHEFLARLWSHRIF